MFKTYLSTLARTSLPSRDEIKSHDSNAHLTDVFIEAEAAHKKAEKKRHFKAHMTQMEWVLRDLKNHFDIPTPEEIEAIKANKKTQAKKENFKFVMENCGPIAKSRSPETISVSMDDFKGEPKITKGFHPC